MCRIFVSLMLNQCNALYSEGFLSEDLLIQKLFRKSYLFERRKQPHYEIISRMQMFTMYRDSGLYIAPLMDKPFAGIEPFLSFSLKASDIV